MRHWISSCRATGTVVLMTLLGLVPASWTNARAQAPASALAHMKPGHAAVLKAWLTRHPELRPLTRADLPAEFEPVFLKMKVPNHPYYLVGDFNHDRVQDFAVEMLEVRDTTGMKTVVAIFNGPFVAGRRQAPAFLTQDPALEHDRRWVLGDASTNRRDWTPLPYMRAPCIGDMSSDGLGSVRWFLPHGKGYTEEEQWD
jgi:hypothetical protein